MNILYVENHSVFAASVSKQFLSSYAVLVVPSLFAARQAMDQRHFDLLLVDFDLDDGKGDDLIRSLRDSNDLTPIIGVSAHDEGNAALLKAGAMAVCGKMQIDQIQVLIETVLRPLN